MKNKIFTLLLICTTSCLSSSDKIEFPDQTTAHTLAVQNYADFLENTSFYAFVPSDFQDTPTDTTQHSKIYPVSLYQRYQKLPDTLQEHIASYLPNYQVNRPTYTKYVAQFKYDLETFSDGMFFENRMNESYYKKIAEPLRIAYWQRFVDHAQKKYSLFSNNRMKPSDLCLNLNNTRFCCLNYPINKLIQSDLSEKKSIEIIMLLIACGALVTTQDYRQMKFRTPLYFAIQQDHLPLVKFLMQAGLTRLEHTGYQFPKPLIVHAGAKNALQTITYLHQLGYNLNEQDTDGNTALHLAYYYNNAQAINLLFDLGADPTIRNNFNELYNHHTQEELLRQINKLIFPIVSLKF